MAGFFSSQLDFILFFYGLAFILLGATCVALARGFGENHSWLLLGLFGFLHGVGEWLDLTALVLGDTPVFATVRVALMTASFALLLEFARRHRTFGQSPRSRDRNGGGHGQGSRRIAFHIVPGRAR